nr:hypothetical protein [Tanacetum cinerariifolium]
RFGKPLGGGSTIVSVKVVVCGVVSGVVSGVVFGVVLVVFEIVSRIGPRTPECTISNRSVEDEILLLNNNAENFESLQPLQSDISWVSSCPNALVDAKNHKREPET